MKNRILLKNKRCLFFLLPKIYQLPKYYMMFARKILFLPNWGRGGIGGNCPLPPSPTPMVIMVRKERCRECDYWPAVSFVLDLEGEEAESDAVSVVLGQYQPLAVLLVVVVVVAVLGVREQLPGLVRRDQRPTAHYTHSAVTSHPVKLAAVFHPEMD